MPDNNDPNSVTGTLVRSGATPGGLGLAGLSLAPDDQISSGVLLILIDVAAPRFLGGFLFGFDPTGSFIPSGLSRQNPQLAGMSSYVQGIEVSPALASSPVICFELTLYS